MDQLRDPAHLRLGQCGHPTGGRALDAAAGSPITLGVILGLVVGKTVGITGFAWLAVRARAAELPEGATWPSLAGVAAVAGIGFTVAIFIAGLAFDDPALQDPGQDRHPGRLALGGAGGAHPPTDDLRTGKAQRLRLKRLQPAVIPATASKAAPSGTASRSMSAHGSPSAILGPMVPSRHRSGPAPPQLLPGERDRHRARLGADRPRADPDWA